MSVPKTGDIKDTLHALGAYSSVDLVRELGEGKVEVIMACCVSFLDSVDRVSENGIY